MVFIHFQIKSKDLIAIKIIIVVYHYQDLKLMINCIRLVVMLPHFHYTQVHSVYHNLFSLDYLNRVLSYLNLYYNILYILLQGNLKIKTIYVYKEIITIIYLLFVFILFKKSSHEI